MNVLKNEELVEKHAQKTGLIKTENENKECDEYFNITENAKKYPLQPWCDSDDIACFGVPCDEGLTIMPMFEAMAFVASNDITSMIALKIPKDIYDKIQNQESDCYGIEMKEEYFLDYYGKIVR